MLVVENGVAGIGKTVRTRSVRNYCESDVSCWTEVLGIWRTFLEYIAVTSTIFKSFKLSICLLKKHFNQSCSIRSDFFHKMTSALLRSFARCAERSFCVWRHSVASNVPLVRSFGTTSLCPARRVTQAEHVVQEDLSQQRQVTKGENG